MPTSGPPEHPWLIPATHNRETHRGRQQPGGLSAFVPVPPTNPHHPTNTIHVKEETRSCKPSSTPPFTPPPASRTSLGGHRGVPCRAERCGSLLQRGHRRYRRSQACAPTVRCWPSASKQRSTARVVRRVGWQLFINGKMLTVKRRRGRPRRSPVRRTRCRSCRFRCICRPPPRSGPPESLPNPVAGSSPDPATHDPPPPAPASPTARVTSIELRP